MKVQKVKPQYVHIWTFDAWKRAFDWDQGHPDEAATFLRFHGLEGNFGNLTAKALWSVGFTALYANKRIEPGRKQDMTATLNSMNGLTRKINLLNERLSNLERKNCIKLSITRAHTSEIIRLGVQPSDTITDLKRMIREWEGEQYLVAFWRKPELRCRMALILTMRQEHWGSGALNIVEHKCLSRMALAFCTISKKIQF
jgi:hypothetical protein